VSYQPPCELTAFNPYHHDGFQHAETGRTGHHKGWLVQYLIGPKLRARSLASQRGEVAIAVAVLNGMIRTAKPVIVRIA